MLNLAGMGIAFRAKPLVRQSAGHSLTQLGLDGLLYLIGVRDRDLRNDSGTDSESTTEGSGRAKPSPVRQAPDTLKEQ
jgi:hypothetical protein